MHRITCFGKETGAAPASTAGGSGAISIVMKKTVDELLQTPYWIIDIFPVQVPPDSPGQFFAVERYFLAENRLAAIKQKHINLILKLNCYRSVSIDEEAAINPPPERIAGEIRSRYLYIMLEDSMILSEPDDTHLTLFNPDKPLLELVKTIAAGEGLFVWKPAQ